MSIESLLLQKVLDEYVTDAQKANFASMMAPGAGYLDAAGQFPSPGGEELSEAFTGEPYPSFAENIERGGMGYLDAGLQGLGVAGDTLYAAPFVGPPLGTALKGLGAFGLAMRAGSKAGKTTKPEEGIATLGKQPMFTPEDTLNLAYTPDGSYSPGIKDLIEKASPKLRGQGITQWANKNLKPKELEVLGIDEFIKANPKATLKETVEGISGNKVVVGKKVLGGGEGQVMDFQTTYPTEDPLDGSPLHEFLTEDIEFELNPATASFQKGGVNYQATLDAQKEFTDEFINLARGKGYDFDGANISNYDEITKLYDNAKYGDGVNEVYDEAIDNLAMNLYQRQPYELIRPTGVDVGDNTFAFGDENVGYQIFVDGQRKTDPGNIAYSRTEAQIKLRDEMADEGYDMFRLEVDDYDPNFDNFIGETRYKQYVDDNLPGGKNYREIIYTYEGADETHNLAHSAFNPEEGNYLAHALVRDRKLADGTETLHGDEIQSDLHKRFEDGYRTPEKVEEINSQLRIKEQEILKQADIVEDMLIKKGLYTKQDPVEVSIFNTPDNNPNLSRDFYINNYLTTIRNIGKTDPNTLGTTTTTYDDVAYNASELRDFLRNQQTPKSAETFNPLTDFEFTDAEFESIYDLSKLSGQANKLNASIDNLLPNYPYKKDYHEIVLKKMLLQAVEEGKPAISVSSSAPMIDRYSDSYEEFYKILYDQDIPKSMRKLAKKYGGEFEVGSLDIDNTFGSGTEKFLAAPETGLDRRRNLVKSNIIKITEEMRNKILLEGIPDFAIGGIVNKGIAQLRTAKKPTEGIVDLGLY
jgi:hypothetical protein